MKRSILSLALKTLIFIGFFQKPSTARSAEVLEEIATQRMHIIVIGVSQFSDSFWPNLKWAASDTQTFAQKIGVDSGYRKGASIFLNENATLAKIRTELETIATTATKDDIVLLYVSSHGTLRKGPSHTVEPVIVLHDSNHQSLARSSLSHRELRHWLTRIKSRRKAIVLATCHSGVGKSKFTDEIKEFKRGEKGKPTRSFESISEGSLILAASAQNETALESDDLKSDVYSHFLFESLDAGDKNSDGAVSLLEAHDYARLRTYAYTKGRQRPTVDAQMIGDADFPIKGRRNRTGQPILEAYSSKYEGFLVGVGKGEPIELPTAMPLSDGDNRITITESAAEYKRSFLVTASPGDIVTLDALLKPPPYWIAGAIVHNTVDDVRFEKITGSRHFTDTQLRLGMRRDAWSLAALYNRGGSLNASPLPNLRSNLSHSALGIEIGRSFSPINRFQKFEIQPLTHLFASTRTLSFQDKATSESLSSDVTSYGIGYGVTLSNPIPLYIPKIGKNTIHVDLSFVKTHEKTSNFSPFGSMSFNSTAGRLGLTLRFGGTGVEI